MRVFRPLHTSGMYIHTRGVDSGLSLTTIMKVLVSNSQKQSVSNAFQYVVLRHYDCCNAAKIEIFCENEYRVFQLFQFQFGFKGSVMLQTLFIKYYNYLILSKLYNE